MPNHESPANDPELNVLYNKRAMEILEDARSRLELLGLHCSVGPDVLTMDDSAMAVNLRVSTASETLDECLAASILINAHLDTPHGRRDFDVILETSRNSSDGAMDVSI